MRIRVEMKALQDAVLPWDYQYYLGALIYKGISKVDEDLAAALHSYHLPKLYTFSWLRGKLKAKKEGLEVEKGETYHFFISSPNSSLLSVLTTFFILLERNIRIKNVPFEVLAVHLRNKTIKDVCVRFWTLSPILVRGYDASKKNPHIDLEPKDARFFENLKKNAYRKYRLFYGEEPPSFTVTEVYSPVRKRIKVKDTYNIAWLMGLHVCGSPRILQFLYDAGLGERTAMGFGMVELWEKG